MNITNLERLKIEIKGIALSNAEIHIYLAENGLYQHDAYNATSNSNKRAIYAAALSALESIANNPSMMKSIKVDDMTVSEFHDNLMKRIDQLEGKIRTMPKDDDGSGTGYFLMYN